MSNRVPDLMTMHKLDRHEFALYNPATIQPLDARLQDPLIISDKTLVQRLTRILRIEPQETFILFDQTHNVRLQVKNLKKNYIETAIIAYNANVRLTPDIQILLPILKRDALQEAIYSCVELGANRIWLVNTRKSQRLREVPKDLERLRKIAISAAEQSKCFAFADIQVPLDLPELLDLFDYHSCNAIFCEPQATPFLSEKNSFNKRSSLLLIGPEGDLTAEEKELLGRYPFIFRSLTPTILRAQQAATVALGLLRALLISNRI